MNHLVKYCRTHIRAEGVLSCATPTSSDKQSPRPAPKRTGYPQTAFELPRSTLAISAGSSISSSNSSRCWKGVSNRRTRCRVRKRWLLIHVDVCAWLTRVRWALKILQRWRIQYRIFIGKDSRKLIMRSWSFGLDVPQSDFYWFGLVQNRDFKGKVPIGGLSLSHQDMASKALHLYSQKTLYVVSIDRL